MRSLPIVAAVGLFSIIGGCGGGNSDSRDSLSDSSFSKEMPDTMTVDKDSVAKPQKISTTAEILEYIKNSPDRDKYNKGILLQMARDVPEYTSKLLDNEYPGFLIVDKNTMKLYRYDKYGVEVERVGIACSRPYGNKHVRRDNRTPEGFFTIENIYDSTEWLYTDDDGNTSQVKGQFGPRFMRLKVPDTTQIGIHGTRAPWSIGSRASHGCIRMTNENILRFAKICSAGWPVIVSPGPLDMAVNASEGYYVPSVAVIPGVPRCTKSDKVPRQIDYTKVQTHNNDSTKLSADSVVNPSPSVEVSEAAPSENVVKTDSI